MGEQSVWPQGNGFGLATLGHSSSIQDRDSVNFTYSVDQRTLKVQEVIIYHLESREMNVMLTSSTRGINCTL